MKVDIGGRELGEIEPRHFEAAQTIAKALCCVNECKKRPCNKHLWRSCIFVKDNVK